MIAIDTSALMAIILGEPAGEDCAKVLSLASLLLISAATLAEALVVADRRGVGHLMREILARLPFEIVPETQETALRIAAIYAKWGKGVHSARLGLIDCFSYDVARQHDCPLLFVGNDFSQTDIAAAIAL